VPVGHARVGLAGGQRGGAPLQHVQLPGRELRAGLRARARPSRPASSCSRCPLPRAGLTTAPQRPHALPVTNEVTAVAAARLAGAAVPALMGQHIRWLLTRRGHAQQKPLGAWGQGAPAGAAAPAAAQTTAVAAALASAPGSPTGRAARAPPGSPRARACAARPARRPRSSQQLQQAARLATAQQGPRSGSPGERGASARRHRPSGWMPACARAPDTADQGRRLPACTQRQTAAREGRHAAPPMRCQGVAGRSGKMAQDSVRTSAPGAPQ